MGAFLTGGRELRPFSLKLRARALLGPLAVAAFAALCAPAAHALSVPVWEAGTCEVRGCTYTSPSSDFYTQAAGHPEWGITSFELATTGSGVARKPEGQVKRLRVDVPPGLAANPQTLPSCPRATFESNPKLCASALVGETEVTAALEAPCSGLPPPNRPDRSTT